MRGVRGVRGMRGMLGVLGVRGVLWVLGMLVGSVELAWWQVVDLHPCFDGESFVAIVGIVVEEVAVACAEHVLKHLLGFSIGGEFWSVSFSRWFHGG